MKKFWETVQDKWYGFLQGGMGSAIIIWLVASGLYYIIFSTVKESILVPLTIGGFFVGFFFVCKWLWKNRK